MLFYSCSFKGKLGFFPSRFSLCLPSSAVCIRYDGIDIVVITSFMFYELPRPLESIINFGKFSAIISSTISFSPFPPYSPSDVTVMHMIHLLILSPRE